VVLRGERCHAPMNGGNRGTRLAQRHALDHLHQFRREFALPRLGALRSCQSHQPGGAIVGQPPLHRSEWDTGSTCHLRERDTLVEVGPEHRKAGHSLLALCLGESGQRWCTGWLLIHNVQCPPHRSSGVRKRIGIGSSRCEHTLVLPSSCLFIAALGC
jgi:hypothetical protein